MNLIYIVKNYLNIIIKNGITKFRYKKEGGENMLNAKNFGLASGILSAIIMFVITLISLGNGYGSEFLKLMTSIYPGYEVSGIGVIIGSIYGFIDGFICFYIFAWIYNKLQNK